MKHGTYRVRDYALRVDKAEYILIAYLDDEAVEYVKGLRHRGKKVVLSEVSDYYEVQI